MTLSFMSNKKTWLNSFERFLVYKWNFYIPKEVYVDMFQGYDC